MEILISRSNILKKNLMSDLNVPVTMVNYGSSFYPQGNQRDI